MQNVVLTSSFYAVADDLCETGLIPPSGANVAFIPTAADPYPERPWIDADRAALVRMGYSVVDVDLKDRTTDGLRDLLSTADVLFVAGGNTTYLAEWSRRSGFGDIVCDLLRDGKLYVGSSAGSILAGPTVEPFAEEDAAEMPPGFVADHPVCLGLVDYVVLPHDATFAATHDKMVAKDGDRWTFVRITDNEYRVETV
ncbi:MAG: Type 1 glutamine amidotransferase-like domain-containing protein [Candidatus Uhrbacteria bacterium]